MPPAKSNRDYYDEFASWYENDRHQGYHAMLDDLEFDLLTPYLPGASVLEVGCGTGLILERCVGQARQAVGVDLSVGMLEHAVGRGLDVVQADATALPFASDTFDLAYSFKVLAHVHDIAQALAEIARVTRPGGMMILEFYNPWSLRYAAKRLGGPGRISEGTRESAVFTRWDSIRQLADHFPPQVRLLDYAGVRVLTPFAGVHRIPGVGRLLRRAEWASRDSLLKYFGGFLVVKAQRL